MCIFSLATVVLLLFVVAIMLDFYDDDNDLLI